MRVNFSELLDGERLRSLWGRSVDPSNAVDTLNRILSSLPSPDSPESAQGSPAGTGAAAESAQSAASAIPPPLAPAPPELVDLAEVPVEPPHKILDALEAVLHLELGARSAMLRGPIEALRVRVHRLDPTAELPPYHPLRHSVGGTIPQILSRLEDTLLGLRRAAGK